MLLEELSEKWEEEKLEAMSIDTSFAQLTCYKGQERNEVVAGGRSGAGKRFFNAGERAVCLFVDEEDLIHRESWWEGDGVRVRKEYVVEAMSVNRPKRTGLSAQVEGLDWDQSMESLSLITGEKVQLGGHIRWGFGGRLLLTVSIFSVM